VIDELLAQFLIEGREQALEASVDLVALQRAPQDAARLDSCFRAVHTLKGSADLLGLKALGRVLHVAEDRLGALRGGAEAAPDFTSLVAVVDQVERWLDVLEATGALPADADSVADRLLARLGSNEGVVSSPVVVRHDENTFAGKTGTVIRYTPRADCYFAGDDPIALIASVPGLAELRVGLREPVGDVALYDPFTCNLVIEALSTADFSLVEAALRLVRDQVELISLEPAQVEPAALCRGGRGASDAAYRSRPDRSAGRYRRPTGGRQERPRRPGRPGRSPGGRPRAGLGLESAAGGAGPAGLGPARHGRPHAPDATDALVRTLSTPGSRDRRRPGQVGVAGGRGR
jgi:HPt (histidine-containing phosphotransfer) domain-containing protein